MPIAQASVEMPTPARYMARLCNHFTHRVTVHREADRARIEFPNGLCALQATEQKLEMRLEAADAATLERLEQVVARHLKQVASAETFQVTWARSDN
jgi:uncharacterized protein